MTTTQGDANSDQRNTKPSPWFLLGTVVIMLWVDFLFVAGLRGSSAEALGVYMILYAVIAPLLAMGFLRANYLPSKTSMAVIVCVALLATMAKYLLFSIVKHAG